MAVIAAIFESERCAHRVAGVLAARLALSAADVRLGVLGAAGTELHGRPLVAAEIPDELLDRARSIVERTGGTVVSVVRKPTEHGRALASKNC